MQPYREDDLTIIGMFRKRSNHQVAVILTIAQLFIRWLGRTLLKPPAKFHNDFDITAPNPMAFRYREVLRQDKIFDNETTPGYPEHMSGHETISPARKPSDVSKHSYAC